MRGCVPADTGRRLCQRQCLEPSGLRLGCPGAGVSGGREAPRCGQEQENGFFLSRFKGRKSVCLISCCFHSSVNFLAELFLSKPALSGWASIQFFQMKRKQRETGKEKRGGEGEEQMEEGRKQKRRDGPCFLSDPSPRGSRVFPLMTSPAHEHRFPSFFLSCCLPASLCLSLFLSFTLFERLLRVS